MRCAGEDQLVPNAQMAQEGSFAARPHEVLTRGAEVVRLGPAGEVGQHGRAAPQRGEVDSCFGERGRWRGVSAGATRRHGVAGGRTGGWGVGGLPGLVGPWGGAGGGGSVRSGGGDKEGERGGRQA